MFLAIFCVALAAIFFFYLKFEYSSYVRTIDLIPGPPKVPFFGNALSIPLDPFGALQTISVEWPKKYGHFRRGWFGLNGYIDISCPIAAEEILSSQKFIDKGKEYSLLMPWLGEGLLTSTGDRWRKRRRLLTPAFHFQILDNFFDTFNKNADILCQQLHRSLSKKAELNQTEEIEVFPYLKRCTLDIICEAAMGIQINSQLENSEYPKEHEYPNAVHRYTMVLFEYFNSIWSFFPQRIYFMTKHGKEYQKCLKIIHDFTSKVIQDRKKEIDQEITTTEMKQDETEESQFEPKKRRAFLDLMLIAAKEGADLTDMDIRNEVDTFMFEGHDTTACAAVWFLYCMAIHPDCQELAREELNAVFGDSDRPCTIEDASKLKYLECCIKETLRLYPSVPHIKRYNTEDFVLSNGFKIPAGASYSIHIYTLHRNEEFFPDPLSFKPERFYSDQCSGRHPFAFVPFSAGPRNCIGQRFALYEEKVIFSTLLRRFRFTYNTTNHGPAKACADMLLKPHHDMPLGITPLKTKEIVREL
ncbi:cytochrome P450 4C1-like isoform X4 [Daphnia pulex]|uniref:cytochrome P450 4C1-like isoform X4 n=1 Tax=Daphnia pulex TaxID=6669 RepID=UPI001EDEA250|nr:cytochrome P450 4C1-like isoform X4 [Daphnia pulex]